MQGYLVVVADPKPGEYTGVDRVPPYPAEFADEREACEAYALGEFKSTATNLIETLEQVQSLMRMFAMSSRSFEVLWCDTETSASTDPHRPASILYGYDVAALSADYWSIVKDMSQEPWASKYRAALNEFGLIGERSVAEDYLHEYRANSGPDADAPFEVVRVTKVTLRAVT